MSIKQKQAKYPASLIAKYFVLKANETNEPITNKKLQKLLYYAQAWHLVFQDRPLFQEQLEAWVHGPAVRSVYGIYKNYGFNPIQKDVSKSVIARIDKEARVILDEVWRVYGKYDALYLERLTHNEKPWQKARKELEQSENSTNIIDLECMKEYYRGLLQETKKTVHT